MEFNESSNFSGIVQDVDFICGTDATSFPLKDKARIGNKWMYKAVTDLIAIRGRFEFDDPNLTTLPITYKDLVAGQRDYDLPEDLLILLAVEVIDNNGNYTRLKELDLSDLKNTITDYEDTDGMPTHYDVSGDSVHLYPAPAEADVTLTNGLRVYHVRKIDELANDDTTQEPCIPVPFHPIVSLGISYEWLLVNGTQDKVDRVRNEIEQTRKEMRKFEVDKNRDKKTNIRPKRENYK